MKRQYNTQIMGMHSEIENSNLPSNKVKQDTDSNVSFLSKIVNLLIPDIFKSNICPDDCYYDTKNNTFEVKFLVNAPGGHYNVHISVSCMPKDKNDTYVHFLKIKFPDGVVRKITYESKNMLIEE